MIVGMNFIRDFRVNDSEELIKELWERDLIDFTFDEIKELVKKQFNGADFDDVQMDDDCISYILEDLAKGNYYWEYKDDEEMFIIYVVDLKDPFYTSGHIPNNKVKVKFT